MPGLPIPGAPGFYAPGGVTNLDEWLKRLRFGGSETFPTEQTDEEGVPLSEDPEYVRRFLSGMNTPAPSLEGGYTRGVISKIGQAAPETVADLDILRPPEFYDLPQDELLRQRMFEYEQYKDKLVSEATAERTARMRAEAAQTTAEADLEAARNRVPSRLNLNNLFRGMEQGGGGAIPGGAATEAAPAPGAAGEVPPLGREVHEATTPGEDIRSGDWTIRGGRRYIWDGQNWNLGKSGLKKRPT